MKITHANIWKQILLRSLKSLYLSTSQIDGLSNQVRHKPQKTAIGLKFRRQIYFRQNIFFVKFDAEFVLNYATKILIEKVMPKCKSTESITHNSAKFRNVFFFRFQAYDHV